MKKDWKDPYYQYSLPKRKVTVDVTGSIPVFERPVTCLSDVESILKERRLTRIIDFGAGKLRNTLYLLHRGYTVWGVEFANAFERPAAKKMYEKADKFAKFFVLQYPEQFLTFNESVDAVLLINVINVVPEKSHRKKIVQECAARLKQGGLLFWMTQYGEPHYRPGVTNRLKITDGWAYNLHKKYQTFYREYTIPEMEALVPSSTFRQFRKITMAHHRAFLFEKI